MARRKGIKNTSTTEFYQYYDELCEIYGDPLEVLFDMQGDPLIDDDVRIKAAKELIGYRHAKRRAIEVSTPAEPIGINIDKDDSKL